MNTTYNTSIEFSLRLQKALFPVIISLSVLASAIFSALGFEKKIESIYVLLLYILLVQATYDFAARRAQIADQRIIQEEPELQLPFFDDARPFVFAWLLWWIATALLFNAKIVYMHTLVGQLSLVTFVLLYVLLRFVIEVDVNNFWSGFVRATLRALCTALLFFPSKDWSPHHTPGLESFLRVCIFFGTVLVLNGMIINYRERVDDNLVITWWLLMTPWNILLIVLPLILVIVFFSQTRKFPFVRVIVLAVKNKIFPPPVTQAELEQKLQTLTVAATPLPGAVSTPATRVVTSAPSVVTSSAKPASRISFSDSTTVPIAEPSAPRVAKPQLTTTKAKVSPTATASAAAIAQKKAERKKEIDKEADVILHEVAVDLALGASPAPPSVAPTGSSTTTPSASKENKTASATSTKAIVFV